MLHSVALPVTRRAGRRFAPGTLGQSMLARGVEYAIAILLVVALIWVEQFFVIRGTFGW